MKLDDVVFRLLIVLLPGILGSKVYRKLRGASRDSKWNPALEIVTMAVLSYAIYTVVTVYTFPYAIFTISGRWDQVMSYTGPAAVDSIPSLQALTESAAPIPWLDVLWASGIGILLAGIASLAHNRRWINRLGYHIGITIREGDDTVWSLFNQDTGPPTAYEWAVVRDLKANIMYFGAIERFDADGSLRELTFTCCRVYSNQDAKELYQADHIYLAREAADLSIEYTSNYTSEKQEPSNGERESKSPSESRPAVQADAERTTEARGPGQPVHQGQQEPTAANEAAGESHPEGARN